MFGWKWGKSTTGMLRDFPFHGGRERKKGGKIGRGEEWPWCWIEESPPQADTTIRQPSLIGSRVYKHRRSSSLLEPCFAL